MLMFFLQIVSSVIGIYLASRFVPGFSFDGDLTVLLGAGALLGVINFFIKPVIKVLSFPLILLSFGLFSIIINMLLLWATDYLVPELRIESIVANFLATLIIGAANFLARLIVKKHPRL